MKSEKIKPAQFNILTLKDFLFALTFSLLITLLLRLTLGIFSNNYHILSNPITLFLGFMISFGIFNKWEHPKFRFWENIQMRLVMSILIALFNFLYTKYIFHGFIPLDKNVTIGIISFIISYFSILALKGIAHIHNSRPS